MGPTGGLQLVNQRMASGIELFWLGSNSQIILTPTIPQSILGCLFTRCQHGLPFYLSLTWMPFICHRQEWQVYLPCITGVDGFHMSQSATMISLSITSLLKHSKTPQALITYHNYATQHPKIIFHQLVSSLLGSTHSTRSLHNYRLTLLYTAVLVQQ